MFNEDWMVGFFMGCGAIVLFFWSDAMLLIHHRYKMWKERREEK